MKDRYLKARLPCELYCELQACAAEAGTRLGTHVREILERDAQVLSMAEALTRIESALSALPASSMSPPAPMRDHELHREVFELRLLVREIAMQLNAQILTRVASQIATQAASSSTNRSTP